MNIIIRSILKKFYIPILDNYSVLRRNGLQLIDVKCYILKQYLKLDNRKYLNEKATELIDKLDIIDLMTFIVWFNSSLKSKVDGIPRINDPTSYLHSEKNKIIEIAFKSGDWWIYKNDIKDNSQNLLAIFTELGENIINSYKLI
jgi:hypothetical protein